MADHLSSHGWKYVLIAVAGFLVCKAIEIVALAAIGEKATGIIQSVTEKPTRHGKSYEVYYEFKTEDQSLIGGVDSYHRKAGQYGSVPVRYLPGYPRVNRVEMTTSAYVLMVCLYAIPGVLMLAFGVRGLWAGRRKSGAEAATGLAATPEGTSIDLVPVLCLCGSVLLGVAGYGSTVPGLLGFGARSAEETTPEPPAGEPGNLQGNLNNGGRFAASDGWVYFIDTTSDPNSGGHSIHRMKQDGAGLEKLVDGPAQYLNLINDTLYYLKWEPGEGDRIHRVACAGGPAKRLLKDRVMCLHAQGEWLYFTLEFDNEKLYRSRLDGSSKQKLNDDVCRYVNVSGQWIYYGNDSDGMRLYRVQTNGANRGPIGKESIQELVVQGDWAYFRNQKDAGKLYRTQTNATGLTKLSDEDAHWLNADGEWLYFSDFGDDGRLYRMPLSGGNAERLCDQSVTHLHVLGSWLYLGVGELLAARPHRLKMRPEVLPLESVPPK